MKSKSGILINYFRSDGSLATARYLKIENQLCVDSFGALNNQFNAVVLDEDQHVCSIPVASIIGLAQVLK